MEKIERQMKVADRQKQNMKLRKKSLEMEKFKKDIINLKDQIHQTEKRHTQKLELQKKESDEGKKPFASKMQRKKPLSKSPSRKSHSHSRNKIKPLAMGRQRTHTVKVQD